LEEIDFVISTFKKMPEPDRPLLVIGMVPESGDPRRLLDGLRLACRTDSDRYSGESMGVAQGISFRELDVVLIQTRGEFAQYISVADAAIIANDRNLFEPLLYGIPTIYLNGDWKNNHWIRNWFEMQGAIIRGGQDSEMLRGQLDTLLLTPTAVSKMARQAMTRYNENVLPALRFMSSLALGVSLFKRAPQQLRRLASSAA
jgi:hypothetical protein